MNKTKYILVFAFIIFAYACQENASNNETQATADDKIPVVETINPTQESFSSKIVISSTIKADKFVNIYAMEDGYVSKLYVDIGDKVKSGQILAQLSNPILELELQEAGNNVMKSEGELILAQAKQELALVNSTNKAKQYNRLKSINDKSKGLTTAAEIENAEADYKIATSEEKMAKAEVAMVQNMLEVSKTRKDAIQKRLNLLSIRAPFKGIISNRMLEQGAIVQNSLKESNALSLFSLESISPVRLVMAIPESDVANVTVDQVVHVTFPSMNDKNFTAKISRISESLDPSSKTMEAQVDIPNEDLNIKPGMYAKAELVLESPKTALSLPHTSILMKKDQAYILLNDNGHVRSLKLQKGINGERYFEVLNPELTLESEVILNGKNLVKDGQLIKTKKHE